MVARAVGTEARAANQGRKVDIAALFRVMNRYVGAPRNVCSHPALLFRPLSD